MGTGRLPILICSTDWYSRYFCARLSGCFSAMVRVSTGGLNGTTAFVIITFLLVVTAFAVSFVGIKVSIIGATEGATIGFVAIATGLIAVNR